jgi:hypothetical protein
MRRNLATGAVLAISLFGAGAGVSTAAPAIAAAVVIRDAISTPFSDLGLTDECRAGITGDLSGTEVVESQSVETSTGFHVVGTITETGRIDWSDGSYTVAEGVDHFSFTTGTQTTVFTKAHQDAVNTYSASGEFLFMLTFHIVERFTVSGGVTRVEFERGHLHSFGDC